MMKIMIMRKISYTMEISIDRENSFIQQTDTGFERFPPDNLGPAPPAIEISKFKFRYHIDMQNQLWKNENQKTIIDLLCDISMDLKNSKKT